MTQPRREAMSGVDAAWMRMEDPTNLMMVSGLLLLDRPPDQGLLRATVEQRLLPFARFRQRVVQPRIGMPQWEEQEQVDLDYHLQKVSLPPPGDEPALRQLVSGLMSTPLDFSRPLWQLHVVEGCQAGGALLARLHHCIADGVALMQVLLSMTQEDTGREGAAARWAAQVPVLPRPLRRAVHGAGGALRRLAGTARTTGQATGKLVQEGVSALLRPEQAWQRLKHGVDMAAALGRITLLPADPPTVFRGRLSVAKRAAWSKPLPLSEVKVVKEALGATVNDVLLTAMTGSLRSYLRGRGEPVDELDFRAAVPVNLRREGQAIQLGNKFGLVFLPLPVGIADVRERLREIKRRMDALKASTEALVAFGVLKTVGMAPSEVQRIVVNLFGSKATAVMTNLPGPRQRLLLAGSSIEGMMFWVPASGRLGLGVSILSYAGQVRLGVASDGGLVSDPEGIVAAFHQEFDLLGKVARDARR